MQSLLTILSTLCWCTACLEARPSRSRPNLAVLSVVNRSQQVGSANQSADVLSRAIKKADRKIAAMRKELDVQRNLQREKQLAAEQAEDQAGQLRVQVMKLRQVAQVAAEIAMEKANATKNREKQELDVEQKARDWRAEEFEAEKFFNETQTEEKAAERTRSVLQKELVAVKSSSLSSTGSPGRSTDTTACRNVSHVVPGVASHAAKVIADVPVTKGPAIQRSEKKSTVLIKTRVVRKAVAVAQNESGLTETMEKLLEENRRLKVEKDELARKLAEKQVAEEKSKLKEKMRNRLVVADRRMTAKL
eukprot:TRINITY_DN2593_c0_g1_i2.p1 TRINITY_DN2593_c0_g1~~TRINITY_DN2593_c0_g1_i2.p1  ORF type:complete len:329 (+),score=70.84 TRINITY_DN2593_c0_g1_i2:73-987(+)